MSYATIRTQLLAQQEAGGWFVRESTKRAGGYTLDIRFDCDDAPIVSFRISEEGGSFSYNHGQKWIARMPWAQQHYRSLPECLAAFGARRLDLSTGGSEATAAFTDRRELVRCCSAPTRRRAPRPPQQLPRRALTTSATDPPEETPAGEAVLQRLSAFGGVDEEDGCTNDERIDAELARIKQYYPGLQPPPRVHRPAPIHDPAAAASRRVVSIDRADGPTESSTDDEPRSSVTPATSASAESLGFEMRSADSDTTEGPIEEVEQTGRRPSLEKEAHDLAVTEKWGLEAVGRRGGRIDVMRWALPEESAEVCRRRRSST